MIVLFFSSSCQGNARSSGTHKTAALASGADGIKTDHAGKLGTKAQKALARAYGVGTSECVKMVLRMLTRFSQEDSRAGVFAARCIVEVTAKHLNDGLDISTDAACCRVVAGEMVGRAEERDVRTHCSAGHMSSRAAERFYRDAWLFGTHQEIQEIRRQIFPCNMIGDTT